MEIYTVSLFGHRELDLSIDIESKLDKLLHDLFAKKEYIDILIGRNGEFDLIAASIIKTAIRKYSYGNVTLTLVLPYQKAEYRDNERSYHEYYDEVEICEESVSAHYKAAIQIRNRNMIDRSDLAIFCVNRKGGAYQTMQYAIKQNKAIINLADKDYTSPSVLMP